MGLRDNSTSTSRFELFLFMRVLGIDCGSQTTGYGIVESDGQRHRLVAYGAIRFQSRDNFGERLLKIHQEIQQLIALHRPDVGAVEDQFYLTNFKSVMKLGQIKGVVILTAIQAGLPIVEYSPLAIKSAVTGYGRAEKGQVQVMVKNILGMEEFPQPHDAADALALAICHIHTSATQQLMGKSHKQ
jgi:crossover junction endodeoxyribonuclease RuvC